MAGIYIHIPFCKKACHYCNFHFSTSLKNKDTLLKSIVKEIESRNHFFGGEKIDSIYFGGGTPSLLTKTDLSLLIESLSKHFIWGKDVEFTLEANPEDISLSKVKMFEKLGINRLSIGVQSFNDGELFQLNRAHTAKESREAITVSQEVGFKNVSIDLMFGLPGSTLGSWETTLEEALSYNVSHISCYNLTVEERTALWHFVNKKKIALPPDDKQEEQYLQAHQFLSCHRYEHYEISNYSKSGYRSLHNSTYWNRIPYLGIGPSAHSFKDNVRWWNISNNARYTEAISNSKEYSKSEILSEVDVFNELIMLGLRKLEGVSKKQLKSIRFSMDYDFIETCQKLIAEGLLHENEKAYCLTPELFYLSDFISAQLFAPNEYI